MIFLSDGYMSSQFCNLEVRWAKLYGCNLIGIAEEDARHSPANFAKEKACAPKDLKHVAADVLEPFLTPPNFPSLSSCA